MAKEGVYLETVEEAQKSRSHGLPPRASHLGERARAGATILENRIAGDNHLS